MRRNSRRDLFAYQPKSGTRTAYEYAKKEGQDNNYPLENPIYNHCKVRCFFHHFKNLLCNYFRTHYYSTQNRQLYIQSVLTFYLTLRIFSKYYTAIQTENQRFIRLLSKNLSDIISALRNFLTCRFVNDVLQN